MYGVRGVECPGSSSVGWPLGETARLTGWTTVPNGVRVLTNVKNSTNLSTPTTAHRGWPIPCKSKIVLIQEGPTRLWLTDSLDDENCSGDVERPRYESTSTLMIG